MKEVTIVFTNNHIPEHSEEINAFLMKAIVFPYDETTTNGDLFRYVFETFPDKNAFQYQDDESLFEHFILKNYVENKPFNGMDANLNNLIAYVQPLNNTLKLFWFERPGGGVGLFDENGIRFELRTKEANHQFTPHIHAHYEGQQVSIRISDGSILAGEMSKKKRLQAQKIVLKNQEYLQNKWNEFSIGFRVEISLPLA